MLRLAAHTGVTMTLSEINELLSAHQEGLSSDQLEIIASYQPRDKKPIWVFIDGSAGYYDTSRNLRWVVLQKA